MRAPLLLSLCFAAACASSSSDVQRLQADQREVIAVTERLFDAMRLRDEAALRSILHEKAQIIAVADGRARIRTGDEWVRQTVANPATLDERMFDPEVRIERDLATLWAPYTFSRDGAFSHCGIDSFQFVRESGSWRLISVTFTVQTADCRRAR